MAKSLTNKYFRESKGGSYFLGVMYGIFREEVYALVILQVPQEEETKTLTMNVLLLVSHIHLIIILLLLIFPLMDKYMIWIDLFIVLI